MTGVLASLGVEVFRRRADYSSPLAPYQDDDVYDGREDFSYDDDDDEVYDTAEDYSDDDEPPPLKPAAISELAPRGENTSAFRGVSASGYGRWRAPFKYSGRRTYLGTFDSEEDAARAWDRMMLWCDLHGVVLNQGGGSGQGRVHTSDSIRAALNFAYTEYAGVMEELRGVKTLDAMVQKLQQEGRGQPGAGADRAFTSTFSGVSARPSGRWSARFKHNGTNMYMATFDSEEDAARAWDRMMVWCHLHGVDE